MKKYMLTTLLACLLSVLTAKAQEAYVVLDGEGTLTFYYDELAESRTGTKYSLPENSYDTPAWITDNRGSDGFVTAIQKAVFHPSFAQARPTALTRWFFWCSELTDIEGLQYLNTSEATSTSGMFNFCSSLKTLDLSHFDTHKVTSMGTMFENCLNLTTIYVSELWNTDNVVSSDYMFRYCRVLKGGSGTLAGGSSALLNVSYAHIDGGPTNPGYLTADVNSLYAVLSGGTLTLYNDMYRNAREGRVFDLNTENNAPEWSYWTADISQVAFDATFATAKPTSTFGWFEDCTGLTAIDLSMLNTSEVTNMANMFKGCTALTTADLSQMDIKKVTDMSSMFEGCTSLTTIYAAAGWSTEGVTASTAMFKDCTALKGCLGSGYMASRTNATYARDDNGQGKPGYLTMPVERYYALYAAGTLTFCHDAAGEYPQLQAGQTAYAITAGQAWSSHRADLESVVFEEDFASCRPTNISNWFYSCSNLNSITGLEYLNTSKVTNMTYLFFSCSQLETLDLSHFETSRTTDMSYMFAGCSALKAIDLSSFNTGSTTDMHHMFSDCSQLETLNLSHFNTGNVTDMNHMFAYCNKLAAIDLSGFNTANVTSMNGMFYHCTLIEELNLSNFNTAKVTDMSSMFQNCRALTTIYAGDGWNTESVTSSESMFSSCYQLTAFKGTEFDYEHTDGAYARLDGGAEQPGYLSLHDMPYAVLADGVLTFHYNVNQSEREGTVFSVSLNSNYEYPDWAMNEPRKAVTKIVFDESFKDAKPQSLYRWFALPNLTAIEGLENLNTSETTNMKELFTGAENLESIDLSCLNTAKVTDIRELFERCYKLKSVNLLGLNFESVVTAYQMFWRCYALESIDMSGINMKSATVLSEMFLECTALKEARLVGFSAPAAKEIVKMFSDCTSLEVANLSGTDFSSITNAYYLFGNCPKLMTADLSGCKFRMESSRAGMFIEIPKNALVYLPTGTVKEDFRNGDNMGGLYTEDYYHHASNIVTDEDGDGQYTCPDFRLYNDTVITITTPFVAEKATLERKFTANQRSTVYLPFAFSATDFGTVYQYDGQMMDAAAGIRFNRVKGSSTTAHVPYIIDPVGETITAENVEVETSRSTEQTGYNQMVGVCQTGYVPQGAYCYDAADGKLKHVAADGSVLLRAGRAYFLLPEVTSATGAKVLETSFDDEATGICKTEDGSSADQPSDWYTLDGRKLAGKPASKGIYINNGHKVVKH